MASFRDTALHFVRTRPDASQRGASFQRFLDTGLPSASEEVWRYAPLEDLDLDGFALATEPRAEALGPVAAALAPLASRTIHLVDGFVVDEGRPTEGVDVVVDAVDPEGALEAYASDAFALLNNALTPGVVTVTVRAGVALEAPIVIAAGAGSAASFPRVRVVLERGARAVLVEVYEGGSGSLVDVVGEYEVGPDAHLALVAYQRLDHRSWHVARTSARLASDARLSHAVVGLGARYDRSRNDATLEGRGAENVLRTTFFGAGDQVHDFRTRQFHVAAHTRSTLLSKGAVADQSRSIYTGLIEIEHGARKTDARQTNHNLLLSPSAHADSVPNLEIRENDVVCAHASSVGPLDELQLWYLESRGVPRPEAQRLMIRGFFLEMLDALPRVVADLLTADVDASLGALEVVA